jgi:hypothetical protein
LLYDRGFLAPQDSAVAFALHRFVRRYVLARPEKQMRVFHAQPVTHVIQRIVEESATQINAGLAEQIG